eukprot:GHVU01192390.1.p1 GENE.GHVU01192390.1~~GHVU01192390.1.p1  ORF type:complete len:414 (+),score=57.04 GHVU01192390.1:979-2220(+)
MSSRERRMEVLAGKVLLSIRLDPSEVASVGQPSALYVLVPRTSYPPQLIERAFAHFKQFATPAFGRAVEPWFEFAGRPIQWAVPLGLHLDLLCGVDPPFPWQLTFRFRNFPREGLPSYEGSGHFQSAFMNALKQSLLLLHGTPRPFQELSKQAQLQLFDAAWACDVASFCSVCPRLQPPEGIKRIPLRLHVGGPPYLHALAGVHVAATRTTAEAVKSPYGDSPSLLEVLRDLVPSLFVPSEGSIASDVEVIVHGVAAPLEAPLAWLHVHCAYLDGALHVAIRVPSERVKRRCVEEATAWAQVSGGSGGATSEDPPTGPVPPTGTPTDDAAAAAASTGIASSSCGLEGVVAAPASPLSPQAGEVLAATPTGTPYESPAGSNVVDDDGGCLARRDSSDDPVPTGTPVQGPDLPRP